MLKSLLKPLLAVFTFFVFQNLYAQTETEPNNTPATANKFNLNGSISGAISASDIDWYKVTTTGDGAITLNLTETAGVFASLQLYDADGATPLGSRVDASGGTVSVTVDGLATGVYYVKINAYYDGQTPSYSISNTLAVPAQVNDAEPDSIKAQALALPLNGSKTGHIGYYNNNHRDTLDWYKITTTGDGLIKLTLTSANGYFASARLYDADGVTQLAYAEAAGSTSSISTDGLAAGTYYVRINAYYNNQFVPYVIGDSLFIPSQANDKEPDSTTAQALTLPLNGSATGHIGYFYNNHRDTLDWYKITTASDGLIKLTLTSANGNFASARLYDADGVTQLAYAEAANSTSSISTDGLAAGTYYVRINAYYNNQFVPYIIGDSLFTTVPNDKEPNNTLLTADPLAVNGKTTGHIGYFYNNHRDTLDWYKIVTPKNGAIKLSLTSGNGNYVSGRLYNANGDLQLNYLEAANSTSIITTDGLGAGTYYVQINAYYNNQFVPYTIGDSLFTYNQNDTIPNTYFKQAPTMPANQTVTGDVGFLFNTIRDTVDTWKINYTGTSGNLNLTFNLLPHIGDGGISFLWFQVYQDTSAAPVYNQNFVSASNQINLTGLAQGYYYIKVFAYYNNQFNAYSITDSFVQVNIAQISINTSKTKLNSSSCSADSITYNLSASHSPYTVKLYKNGALYDSVITIAASTTFKGLSAGNYYATVYGDGATDAAFSKSATSVVTPPVPTALSTTGIGVHTATLNWTKVSCAHYYKVQYRAVGSPTWIVINTTGDTSKLALTGLSPYTLYAWQVASVDTTKSLTFTSVFADSITFRTLSDTAHIALTFKGLVTGCNSDTLTYTSTNSAAPYTVTLYRNGVVYGSPLSVTDVASFYNVPPGYYYAKSTGTGSGGSFGLSDTTSILPPAPTGLDTTLVTPTTAMLNWDAVSCSNYYYAQYKVTGTTTWTTILAFINSVTLTGLTPDTKYTWRVSASDSFNQQTVTSAYSDTATFITSSVLPVTFVSFSAVLNNNSALLKWSTSNEINNKGFSVERSNDGAHFNSIGFVDAKFGHSIIDYGFTDNNIISGSDYYRLKQIDVDGNFMYSKTIKLDLSKFAWSVNGNPVINNNSNIQLKLDHTATVSIQIVSLNGSVLLTIHKGIINAGNYTIPLTLNNISAGVYVVKLMVDKDSYTTKIMKQ